MIKYKCDGYKEDGDLCKTECDNTKEWLTISSKDSSLTIINNLKNNRLISMYSHSNLHFCSKDCFLNMFFINENKQP